MFIKSKKFHDDGVKNESSRIKKLQGGPFSPSPPVYLNIKTQTERDRYLSYIDKRVFLKLEARNFYYP